MNQLTLIGRLTADPELSAPKGNPICRYRIAVDRIGTDGADFITIVSFGTRGENDATWLSKGRLVAIAGRLNHNTWTDDDGNNRERYEAIASRSATSTAPRPSPPTTPSPARKPSNHRPGTSGPAHRSNLAAIKVPRVSG